MRAYFLDKTPPYAHFLPELLRIFPEAKFVALWRNPLAVVASIVETFCGGRWEPDRYPLSLYAAPARPRWAPDQTTRTGSARSALRTSSRLIPMLAGADGLSRLEFDPASLGDFEPNRASTAGSATSTARPLLAAELGAAEQVEADDQQPAAQGVVPPLPRLDRAAAPADHGLRPRPAAERSSDATPVGPARPRRRTRCGRRVACARRSLRRRWPSHRLSAQPGKRRRAGARGSPATVGGGAR